MARAPAPIHNGPVEIVLSVEISDGTLASKVRIPVSASADERNNAVARWFEIILFGLKQHGSEIEIAATFPKRTESSP